MKKMVRKLILFSLVGALAFTGAASAQVVSDAVSGGISQISTSCGVSGGPITSIGTIQGSATPNAQTGTTYAIQNSDCGKLLTLSNASAVAVSIAQAGGSGDFASGWFVTIINEGAGVATITPTTSTIDGAASLSLTQFQSVDLFSDGTNYFTARGRASVVSNTYIASSWYAFKGPSNVATGNALTANTIYCAVGYVDKVLTIGAIGGHITTVGSTNVQYALYKMGSDGRPGAKLSSTASVANTSQGAITNSLAANVQVGPGTANGSALYFCTNSGDSTVVFTSVATTDLAFAQYAGATTANGIWNNVSTSSMIMGVSCNGANCNGGSSTLGTWPSTLAGSTWTGIRIGVGAQAPVGQFQVQSIP